MDESIALVEFSKHSERVWSKSFDDAHIEVGLKIWNPRRLGCLFYLLCRLYGFPSESWVVRSGLVDKHGGKRLSVSMRYTWSLYKILASFVQIAFAEPAVSQQCLRATGWCRVESWVTLLCLYIGTVFFAMLVSNMAAIIANACVQINQ